jgi:hypothetical protein
VTSLSRRAPKLAAGCVRWGIDPICDAVCGGCPPLLSPGGKGGDGLAWTATKPSEITAGRGATLLDRSSGSNELVSGRYSRPAGKRSCVLLYEPSGAGTLTEQVHRPGRALGLKSGSER